MSGARLIGKYEIQATLGKGPHGVVYRAIDPELERPVAIKVLARESVEPRALEAFRKYAPGLGRVRHPGIARFIELVEADSGVCLVSELAEGTPLAALLNDGSCPGPKQAWDIARQVLEALAYCHLQGAVHCNLKPGNLLLASDGRVVLTDLGTSMLHRAREKAVEYFTPEHFGHAQLTARSDIHQMGAIAYQLVTGKLPFTGTPGEIAQRVSKERPVDPSSHNKRLAWQLDFVIQRALSKDPAGRFASALDFAEGLRLGMQDTVGRPLQPATAAGPARPTVVAVPAPDKGARGQAPAGTQSPANAVPGKAGIQPTVAQRAAPPARAPSHSAVLQNARILAEKAPERPAPADTGKPGVLFVDDDPRILNTLRALFRPEYNVQTAESGEAALEILGRGGIGVVVSDQRMPAMTGVELLRKARAAAPNAVRILLTGYTDLAALMGSINQGEIFRFVMKPWDNDELRKALAEAVALARDLAGTTPTNAQAPRSAGSLLVIDPNEGVAKGLERLLAGAARVLHVATPAEAAKIIAREEIAAVVADMGTGMDGLVALFRELKAKRPGVLSILLTDEPDSDLAIELINKAQIFRFLPKPVNARELRTQVATALRRYAAFKQRPSQAAASSEGTSAPNRPGELADRKLAGVG